MITFYKRYRLVFFVLTFVVSWFIFGHAQAATPIPAKERVSDVAGVLSAADKASLEAVSKKVETQTGAVLVAVIIKKLDGETIEDYTARLHDAWKPGLDNDGRGSILVISLADRKVRIAPTRAMGITFTDSRTSHVIDEMKPYLKKMEYVNAINTYFVSSAAFAGKAQPAVAPIAAAATVESQSYLLQFFLGGLAIAALVFGCFAIRSNIRQAKAAAKRKIEHEARERQQEEALLRERAQHLANQKKLHDAPDRPNYRKYISLDGSVGYEWVPPAHVVHANEQARRNERVRNNEQARRNEAIRNTVLPTATSARFAAVLAQKEIDNRAQRQRDEESRKQRERDLEEARRKQRRRDEDAAEERRRESSASYYSPSYSSSSSSSSSSDSSFSSSSSSSSDGGGSSSDF